MKKHRRRSEREAGGLNLAIRRERSLCKIFRIGRSQILKGLSLFSSCSSGAKFSEMRICKAFVHLRHEESFKKRLLKRKEGLC